ncbi:hypothetical protein P43SY_010175 [Pythium insidiosum]|uniref:Uncharacterized protein n=1 Tax=Pythium insidiosum TaxID=114742 RepID=A0AAD5LNZ6_PYTIN|nr:hypothetical protein P43SY_010175 [Pythium insidiosum]KAJ0411313.1 hypothetical protein ATCC90586_005722 [Pythium insidiosum]
MADENPHTDQAKRYIRELLETDESGQRPEFSCRWFVDRAFLCVTPGSQMTYYYRNGRADECRGTMSNMFHCFRASLMEESKRVEYLKTTAMDPTTPPHKTDVWEEKETPGW